MKKIRGFKLSVTGKRSTNQDNCAFYIHKNEITLLAVADGMGGHQGGEAASQIAIDTTISTLINLFDKGERDLKKILNSIYSIADIAIREHAQNNPNLMGMGTTLSCVLIYNGKFAWANLGDSRIYFFSQDGFHQITKDHTYLQDYIDQYGDDIPENIAAQSHILTRALNGSGDQPDIFPLDTEAGVLHNGDAFLLCSDGLIPDYKTRYEKVFHEYLIYSESLEVAAQELVQHAEQSGSRDNITVVLAEYGSVIRQKVPGKEDLLWKPGKLTIKPYGKTSHVPRPALPRRLLKYTLFFTFLAFIGLLSLWLYQNNYLNINIRSIINKTISIFDRKATLEENHVKIEISLEKYINLNDPELIGFLITDRKTNKPIVLRLKEKLTGDLRLSISLPFNDTTDIAGNFQNSYKILKLEVSKSEIPVDMTDIKIPE
ncbi:MAG: PP2C family protein-serine/threonine phosphatase [bacterium]